MSRLAERISRITIAIAICITASQGQDVGGEGNTETIDWSEEDDFWTERSSKSYQSETVSPTERTSDEDGFQTSIIFTNLYLPGQETMESVEGITPEPPAETISNTDTTIMPTEFITASSDQSRNIRNLNGSDNNQLNESQDNEMEELSDEKNIYSTQIPTTTGLEEPTVDGAKNYTKISSSSDHKPTLKPATKPVIKSIISTILSNRTPYFSPYDADHTKYIEDIHPCRRECIQGAVPMTCHYNFTLEWYHTMSKACYDCPYNLSDCYRQDCVPADGVKRIIAAINRRLPGPPIEVCLGDTIVVRVDNRLGESTTSMHWHGLPQKQTPYMDGVPFVTQCPILPGTTFVYSFNASVPGTHFYHSHSGIQRGDGAFGSLIIRRPEVTELYDLDFGEHTMIVLDWSHGAGTSLLSGHLHAGGGNKPDSLQINGKGRFANFEGNISTPVATFSVTKGFRYRFRLINGGVMNCPIELSIDGHQLLVISADGNDILPEKVDRLVSYAGERWDFVVAADAPVGNYWIKARGLMDCDERFTSAHQEAVLHYTGALSVLPDEMFQYDDTRRSGKVMNELNAGRLDPSLSAVELEALRRAPDPALTEHPDRTLVFSYDFHPKDNPHFFKPNLYGFKQVKEMSHKIFTPQLNHVSMRMPSFPLLTQANSLQPEDLCSNQNQTGCALNYCECINIINIKLNEVVEIILIDEGETYDANHPFHLHGHSFRVIGMDRIGRNVSTAAVLQLDAAGGLYRNLDNPPIKDTVTVPDGGYTIIRFLANNPGYWLFHCHIEFHVEVGMAVVLKVGEDSEMIPPPAGFPTCGDYDPDDLDNENLLKKAEINSADKLTNDSETIEVLKPNNKKEMENVETTKETVISLPSSIPHQTVKENMTEEIFFPHSHPPISPKKSLIPLNSSVIALSAETKLNLNASENEVFKRPYFRYKSITNGFASESQFSVNRYRSSAHKPHDKVDLVLILSSFTQLLIIFIYK